MRKSEDAPNRGSYHHGDLRRALLEAALGLVGKKGAEGFSLREAARKVGVSPAAAYRHFEDKKALLAALAIDGMDRMATAMDEAQAQARVVGAPGSPARAIAELRVVGEAYVEFAVKNPSHFQVMFGPWCDHPDLTEVPAEARPQGRDAYQILVDSLDALVHSGAVTPAMRQGAEISSWAAVHGLASLLVSETMPLTREERSQALALTFRIQLLGMGCPPALVAPSDAVPESDPRPRPKGTPRRKALGS